MALLFMSAYAQDPSSDEEEVVIPAPSGITTQHFTSMDGYYGEDPQDLSSSTFVGMGIGFAATGLFFIYVAINICRDESQRLEKARSRVEKAKKRLTETYNYN